MALGIPDTATHGVSRSASAKSGIFYNKADWNTFKDKFNFHCYLLHMRHSVPCWVSEVGTGGRHHSGNISHPLSPILAHVISKNSTFFFFGGDPVNPRDMSNTLLMHLLKSCLCLHLLCKLPTKHHVQHQASTTTSLCHNGHIK